MLLLDCALMGAEFLYGQYGSAGLPTVSFLALKRDA